MKPEIENILRERFRTMLRDQGIKCVSEFLYALESGITSMPDDYAVSKEDFCQLGKSELQHYLALLFNQQQ